MAGKEAFYDLFQVMAGQPKITVKISNFKNSIIIIYQNM